MIKLLRRLQRLADYIGLRAGSTRGIDGGNCKVIRRTDNEVCNRVAGGAGRIDVDCVVQAAGAGAIVNRVTRQIGQRRAIGIQRRFAPVEDGYSGGARSNDNCKSRQER